MKFQLHGKIYLYLASFATNTKNEANIFSKLAWHKLKSDIWEMVIFLCIVSARRNLRLFSPIV